MISTPFYIDSDPAVLKKIDQDFAATNIRACPSSSSSSIPSSVKKGNMKKKSSLSGRGARK